MHPGGIKFGLAQGLLELRGAEVVVTGRILENLSEMARRKIRRRKRVMCIWDEVTASGLRHTPYSFEGATRQEYVPFYTGLDRLIYQTMMPIAEQIQMGQRISPAHFLADKLISRINKGPRPPRARTMNEAWRFRFRQIYTQIIALCKENAPEHLRHAELLALCELNNWQTDIERKRMEEFTKSLFSKEFWDKMHGQDS
jgi:hypothetical protein